MKTIKSSFAIITINSGQYHSIGVGLAWYEDDTLRRLQFSEKCIKAAEKALGALEGNPYKGKRLVKFALTGWNEDAIKQNWSKSEWNRQVGYHNGIIRMTELRTVALPFSEESFQLFMHSLIEK